MKINLPSFGAGGAAKFRPRIFRFSLICVYLCSSVVAFLILLPGGIMKIYARSAADAAAVSQSAAKASQPTVEAAGRFIEDAEKRLLDLSVKSSVASWVYQTFITNDTLTISAQADQALKDATAELAAQARRFDGLELPPDVARKFYLLKHSVDIPAPRDAAKSAELSKIAASLQGDYGKGKWCPEGAQGKCHSLNDMENILAQSRDPEELKRVWIGWHAIAPPMRERYTRMVVLANEGSREMGFADVGAMWRSGYDMPADAFSAELDRLWQQVRPLYLSLHAYVRSQLAKKYGVSIVLPDAPIRADLLGNMWAQSWDNIYPLLAAPNADPGFDLTDILKSRNTDALGMVRYGERFFTSLGFAPLPKTFWERSLFTKPRDREVVCHASAWDVDYVDDLRIKMCIEIKDEDFATIHHELGHNFYQRAYDQQPFCSAIPPTTAFMKPSVTRSPFPSLTNI
jgi:peptidyl-dipeptidase A